MHSIELKRKGEIPFRTSVDLSAGSTINIEYSFKPDFERSLGQRIRDWILR